MGCVGWWSSFEKEKCKSLRNFIWGTLRLRIGLYLDAFVKVGGQIVSFNCRFSIQHLYMSVADISLQLISFEHLLHL